MQNLLTISDLKTPKTIQKILDLSVELQNDPSQKPLLGKNFLFSFEKPSLRTKVGTEAAISSLGGNVIHIDPENFLSGAKNLIHSSNKLEKIRESLKDTVMNVNQWCDGIFSRVFSHSTLTALTNFSQIPVINALSDEHHPMQALADLLTIQEVFGKEKKIKIAFVGDANNVAFSLFEICLMMGHQCSFAGPKKHSFSKEKQKCLENIGAKFGGEISFYENPKKAVKNSDAIYTDTFVSMGEESLYEQKIKEFSGFQINSELMNLSGKDTKFLHCLPAHRGEEVTDEVIDSKNSLVYLQAKNRMVVSKGLFSFLTTSI
jgi:ornithine carbamoyltransferase